MTTTSPILAPDLSGVRAKLRRASVHARELKTVLEPFAQAATESIVREDYTEGSSNKVRYRVGYVPDLDAYNATIIGDALFNLRSALDHFAWQLLILDGQTPNRKHQPQFPIHEDALNAKGNPRHIDIAPGLRRQDIRDALIEIQPYRILKDYGHALWDQGLWLISELCNADKHRLLLTVVHVIDLDSPGKSPWWEGEKVKDFGITMSPLNANDVVAEFDFGIDIPDPNFDPHLSLAPTLDEGPVGCWPRTTPIWDLLHGFHDGVVHDLNWGGGTRLVPMFPGEPLLDLAPSQ